MPRLDFYASDLQPFLSVRLVADELVLGRAPDCSVQLFGAGVSRHHARLRRRGDRWSLDDLSRNGTRVNASWAEDATPLAAGDRIYLGHHVAIFQPDEAPVEDLGASKARTVATRGGGRRARRSGEVAG